MAPSSARPDAARGRFPCGFAALSGALFISAAACKKPVVESIRYRMVGLPAVLGGTCPVAPVEAAPALAGATSVRLTFRDHGGPLRCDVVVPLGAGPAPVIDVPDKATPVDLYAEYFDAGAALVGRGQVQGVDLSAGGVVDVPIAPAGAFACAASHATHPRAFHSATPLPDGDVLLVGGLGPPDTGDAGRAFDPAAGLFVTASAELYHPATRTFTPIAIPGLQPRAFHQAYASTTADGHVHVALIGGITVAGDPLTSPALTAGGPLRWTSNTATRGATGEQIDFDPAAGSFTRTELPAGTDVPTRILGALPPAESGAPAAYVGGVDAAGMAIVSFDEYGAAAPHSGALRHARIGATVTPLGGGRALIWGGDPATMAPEAGEVIVGLPDAPATQALTISAGGGQRAFHAAARTGAGLVVVAGGFAIVSGAATAPVPQPGVELTVNDLTATGVDVGGVAGGYDAAVTLPDGDVIASGGSPAGGTATCADATGTSCAIADTWRYPSAGGAGAAIAPMQVARYGHHLTVLPDGTVLVTGGLAPARLGAAGQLAALGDAELLEWRGAGDDPIADLAPAVTRAPGDVVRAGGAPAYPCAIITQVTP